MIRSVISLVLTLAYTIVMGLPAMILSLFAPGSDIVLWFGRYWARWILATAGVSVTMSGREAIDPDGTYIYMSNHQSHLDVLALLVTLPGSFRVVAKKTLFYIPIFGQCIWLMGIISIDRRSRPAAFRSLEKAATRIREGTPILFFIEGTRSRDGRLQPFKKGAFVVAMQAGVPVVPIVIENIAGLLPRGSALIRPGCVNVHFCAPIPTRPRPASKEVLMGAVRTKMLDRLGRERDGSLPAAGCMKRPAAEGGPHGTH